MIFPGVVPHAAQAAGHPRAAAGAARGARAARAPRAAATHTGAAAAADWAPCLRELFVAEVEVRSGGAVGALVLAPPAALRGVVAWLAARPAVHWVDPFPRKEARNRDASASV